MTKVGLIQTRSYENNKKGIENISKLLEKLGKAGTPNSVYARTMASK